MSKRDDVAALPAAIMRDLQERSTLGLNGLRAPEQFERELPEPTDLLLITHDRLFYLEQTLPMLLDSSDDFRIFWWDNASTQQTRDFVEAHKDGRFVAQHMSPSNETQRRVTEWFLTQSRAEVIGKVDDDILLPNGWCRTLSNALRCSARFGMLGCWIFAGEDWRPELASKRFQTFDGITLLRNLAVQGQSCVGRREVLERFFCVHKAGFPINQSKMSMSGLVNGFPVPLVMGHNMDDPRSPLCRFDEQTQRPLGLTARTRKMHDPSSYGDWIHRDAIRRQRRSFATELLLERAKESRVARIARRLTGLRLGW